MICDKCKKDVDIIYPHTDGRNLCGDCALYGYGVSQKSVPSGGSPAAGEGQRACSPDGPVLDSDRRLTLMPVDKIQGDGWYLRFMKREGYMAFLFTHHKDFPKHIFRTGKWWKIPE